MRYHIGKVPIRAKNLIELTCLYAACFFFAGFLSFVEQAASLSFVLTRYFKFIVDHQTIFILSVSTAAILYHYREALKTDTEVHCRLIVGDQLSLIRLRYAITCLTILSLCGISALAIQTAVNLKVDNFLYLFIAFSTYAALTSLLIGRREVK